VYELTIALSFENFWQKEAEKEKEKEREVALQKEKAKEIAKAKRWGRPLPVDVPKTPEPIYEPGPYDTIGLL
jgi:hypothetical protein